MLRYTSSDEISDKFYVAYRTFIMRFLRYVLKHLCDVI